MSRVNLMPCPFCGNDAVLLDTTYIEPNWWCASVMCTGVYKHTCSVQMVYGGSTKEEAMRGVVKSWNTRTDE